MASGSPPAGIAVCAPKIYEEMEARGTPQEQTVEKIAINCIGAAIWGTYRIRDSASAPIPYTLRLNTIDI